RRHGTHDARVPAAHGGAGQAFRRAHARGVAGRLGPWRGRAARLRCAPPWQGLVTSSAFRPFTTTARRPWSGTARSSPPPRERASPASGTTTTSLARPSPTAERGGHHREGPRVRLLLRQAAQEVRPHPRDVLRLCAERLHVVQAGDPALASREAPHAPAD